MRKILFLLLSVCALLAGCRKDAAELSSLPVTIQPYQGGTKVHITGNVAYWDDGDSVRLNGGAKRVSVSGEGHTSIPCNGATAPFYAISPSQFVNSYSSDNHSYSLTLPAIQELRLNASNQQLVQGVMAASGSTSLSFQNLTSLLCVKVPANTVVTCITVRAKKSDSSLVNLCGSGTVSFGSDGQPSLSALSGTGASSEVHLACNRSTRSEYYVVVPALQNVRFIVDIAFLHDGYVCKKRFQQADCSNTLPVNTLGIIDKSSATLGSSPAGVFTKNSSGNKVIFSQGNLQYIGSASTPYWKFADHAYDVIGTAQNSASATIDRDLFGWGTSGWNSGINGITCYQPYETSTSSGSYYPYSLTNTNADWGVNNVISNGGNSINTWYTLTQEEWKFVVLSTARSGSHFVKATIDTSYGLLILPDDYEQPTSIQSLNRTGELSAPYTSNTFSYNEWIIMEANGAVFLPAAGTRNETSTNNVNNIGCYWTTDLRSDNDDGYEVKISYESIAISAHEYKARSAGLSVRLVKNQ